MMIFMKYFVVKLEMLKFSKICYKQEDIKDGVIEEKDELDVDVYLYLINMKMNKDM